MKKFLFLFVAALTVFTSCVDDDDYVPPTPEAGDVVLNEIKSKGPEGDDNDFVELYNKGEAEVNISGYLINDAADPSGGFVIPDGTTIAANGFYVVHQPEFTEAISSSGEDVSLGEPDGTLIDLIFCPASIADGTTFGRKTDGGEEWIEGMESTPGAANNSEIATVNGFYGLNIDNAEGEDMVFNVKVLYTDGDLTSLKFYYVKNYDADDMWIDDPDNPGTLIFDTDTYREDMEITALPSADGSYAFTILAADLMPGDVISWYMRAKNPAGDKMYYTGGKTAEEFDGDIKDDPASWTTEERLGTTIPEGTVNGFSGFSADNTVGGDVVISVKLEYLYGDTEQLKFYYVKNYDAASMWFDDDSDPATDDVFDTDTYRESMEIEDANGDFVVSADDVYTFTIPAADVAAGDEISWYMRAKDPLGDKMYYTDGKTAEEFDGDIKDDPATWAVYTVK